LAWAFGREELAARCSLNSQPPGRNAFDAA
jgi:hypothetical protein